MSLFGSSRREGTLAVLLLLVLSVIMHSPGLFFGQARMLDKDQAKALQHREISTNQHVVVPALQAAGRVVQQGEVPLWNPYSRFGESFQGAGAPILYPPFWILMARGGWRLLDLVLCLHTFLACLCMYRFLRNLPLSRYVSFVGGAMYGLGWFMTVQLDRLPHAAAAALIPLAMGMTWRVLIAHKRKPYALLLACTVALMFTTGGTGTAWLGVFLCLVVYCFGFLALDNEDRGLSLRAAGAACVMVALVTSPLWLNYAAHAGSDAAVTNPSQRHLQAGGLLGLASPTAFGGMTADAPEVLQAINPDSDPMELALYPSACILFLVFLGLLRPKRTAHGLVWILVGGIGLLMTLDSPVGELLAWLSFWRPASPGLGLVLVNISLVSLGSVALENFFEAPVRRRFAVPVTAGLMFLGTAMVLLSYLAPGLGTGLLQWLSGNTIPDEIEPAREHMFLSLVQPTLFLCLIATAFLFWRRMGILRFKVILAVLAISDVMLVGFLNTPRIPTPDESALLSATVPEKAGRIIATGRRPALPTGHLIGAGLPTITTRSSTILARTHRFLYEVDSSMVQVGSWASVSPLIATPLLTDPLLELANVGIGISATGMEVPGFAPIVSAPLDEIDNDKIDVHIYRRHRPVPRVRILFQIAQAVDLEDAVRLINEHARHLSETVVVENADEDFVCKRPGGTPQVEILEDGANRLRIRVDMGQGRGYLLVTDAFAPGWSAEIDGVHTAILPADVAFRAVAVPEGKHEIQFTYSPSWWWLGLPIAGLGVLFGIFWIFLRRRTGEEHLKRVAVPVNLPNRPDRPELAQEAIQPPSSRR